jgi:hypothetical protein
VAAAVVVAAPVGAPAAILKIRRKLRAATNSSLKICEWFRRRDVRSEVPLRQRISLASTVDCVVARRK